MMKGRGSVSLGVSIIIGMVFVPVLPHRIHAAAFSCGSGDVTCLIDAINTANGNGVANTITLDGSTFTLNAVNNTIFGPTRLGGHLKTGQSWTGQNRPVGARPKHKCSTPLARESASPRAATAG